MSARLSIDEERLRACILRELSDHPGRQATSSMLARATGWTLNRVRAALFDMEEAGQVASTVHRYRQPIEASPVRYWHLPR